MVSAQDKMPAELKPGAVFRIDFDEIDEFEGRAKKFRIGDEDQTTFQLYRLSRGIYGQRQEDNQMMRIKLPYGGVTADQMDAMAEVCEKYSGLHRGHITTRENFQFHFVNLDDTAEVMRVLGAAGLTTREACAHTVRNITGCPYAGISPRRGLRHHALPGGLRAQHAAQPDLPAPAAQVQDLVLQLRRRLRRLQLPRPRLHRPQAHRRTAEGVRASRCASAAAPRRCRAWPTRSGSSPRVDDGEYIRVAEAILRIFDREGDLPGLLRKNLNKARIKFLLHKIGVDGLHREGQGGAGEGVGQGAASTWRR